MIKYIDETGTAKSGNHTATVKQEYHGNRGKIENCVNNVVIAISKPCFHCLLDAQLFLPEEWANDPARRKKHIHGELAFRTKPQIARSTVPRPMGSTLTLDR